MSTRSDASPCAPGPSADCLADRRPELVAMLTRMRFPPDEAEEAADAAVLTGLRYLRSGRADALKDRRAWLRRVAVNAARRNARRRLTCDPVAVGAAVAPSSDEAARSDELAALHAAISDLPEDLRRLLTFCTLEQHTYREAAGRFGICAGVVSRRLREARELLAARLTARGVGTANRG